MKSVLRTNEKLSLMVARSSSVSISCFKVQISSGHSGVLMKKPLTVHIYFLIIISLSFFSTVNSFYLPPLIVVFGHMCLLMGALFCRTKTEVTHQKEEYEKVCERLFHLNNCWLLQKCLVSYSVLIDVAKSCICIWHQVVCIEDCRLPGWGEKEDQIEEKSSFSPN